MTESNTSNQKRVSESHWRRASIPTWKHSVCYQLGIELKIHLQRDRRTDLIVTYQSESRFGTLQVDVLRNETFCWCCLIYASSSVRTLFHSDSTQSHRRLLQVRTLHLCAIYMVLLSSKGGDNLFSGSHSDQFVLSETIHLGLSACSCAGSGTVAQKGPLVEYIVVALRLSCSLRFLHPSAPSRYCSHALSRKSPTGTTATGSSWERRLMVQGKWIWKRALH